MSPTRPLCTLMTVLLTGCYLMPYPDHHLTKRDAAWGKVRRGEPYVLVRDFSPLPDHEALRDSSCAGVDDVGFLTKGTVVKFTGFCVRRNYWGSQPFVYAEALGGEHAGKTFAARGLVDVAKSPEARTTRAGCREARVVAPRKSFPQGETRRARTADPMRTSPTPMNRLPCFLFVALLAVVPCRAAVSILVQPGATADTCLITITQTSSGPVTGISGVSGYSLGISLPTAMFNIPGLDPESSSDIFGDLTSPVGTVTEVYSGEMFDLTKLRISANPALGSVLGFDRVFEFPVGAGTLRFEVGSLGPVETNISLQALHQGTHVVEDTLFGTVTVTVIPEPAAALLLPLAAGLAWRRRRGSV